MAEHTPLETHAETHVEGAERQKKDREILICIDGSEHADRAFEWYAQHVHRVENDVICFNVYETPSVGTYMGFGAHVFPAEEWRRISENKLEDIKKLQTRCQKNMKQHHMHGKVVCFRTDHPGHTICEFAKEKNIDFIVMGCRGLGTVRRTLMGSVSDFVLHHAHVPVCVVPPADRHGYHK